jgi:choline dehydrogenase-like flavoprotein
VGAAHDAIVAASGFGGGIAACRLAEAGLRHAERVEDRVNN